MCCNQNLDFQFLQKYPVILKNISFKIPSLKMNKLVWLSLVLLLKSKFLVSISVFNPNPCGSHNIQPMPNFNFTKVTWPNRDVTLLFMLFERWINLLEKWMSFWKEGSPFKKGILIQPWGWITLLKGEYVESPFLRVNRREVWAENGLI